MPNFVNSLGQTRVGWRSRVYVNTLITPLLDLYSEGISAAYSLRKLSSTYTGAAIKVRRSIDNSEMDIGFDSNGNLNTTNILDFSSSCDTSSSKLLDYIGGAEVAYSLRKLRNSYSGPLIRVRRSSDNSEMDIGFDSNGIFDSATLLSFIGSVDGHVCVWYDQSGNNKNAYQTVSDKQPRIVIGGVLQTYKGKPIIRNTYANSLVHMVVPVPLSQMVPVSIILSGKIYNLATNVHNNLSYYVGKIPTSTGISSSPYTLGAYNSYFSISTNLGGSQTINIYSTSTDSFSLQGHFKTNSINSIYNRYYNTSSPLNDVVTSNYSSGYLSIFGANYQDYVPDMGLYEFILYTSDKSSNYEVIDSNLNSHYSLYSYNSDYVYVSKWYDQSGNGKDISQTTASNQPAILYPGDQNGPRYIRTVNGKPSILFSENNYFKKYLTGQHKVIGDNAVSVFNVFSIDNLYPRSIGWDIGNDSYYQFYAFDVNTYNTPNNSFGFYGNSYPAYSNALTNLNQNLLSIVSNTTAGLPINSNTYYYINNSKKTLSSSYSGNMPDYSNASRITVGKFNNFDSGYYGFGNHQELIIYNTNKLSSLSLINSNINSYYSIYQVDSDAQAFITASGITDGVQVSAIITLVTALKTAGIWAKMRAIYPFVGGTDASHKFNLKDPRNLDAAYRLVFNGGWVHSSTGAKPDGTTGYADTNLNTSVLSMTNTSYSIYLRTVTSTTYTWPMDLGVFTADYNGRYGLGYISQDGSSYFDVYNRTTISNTNFGTGFIQYTRTSSNLAKVFYKNNLISTNTNSTNTYSNPNNTVYLGALHLGSGLDSYSNREQSFVSIGDGLTDAEATAFYNAVQAYQTELGRAV